MEIDIKPIMDELKIIKEELTQIKASIPNKDMFLTSDEVKLLEESYQHEKEGKLISDKELRKELSKRPKFDPDLIMTTEEKKRFKQSMKGFKTGKAISLSGLKEELGI